MGHYNRKATKDEMARVRSVISAACPELQVVFGSHSSYGGHRAPRDHTISFRLRDARGKYHSNAVWLMPDPLAALTPEDIRRMVERSNGRQ